MRRQRRINSSASANTLNPRRQVTCGRYLSQRCEATSGYFQRYVPAPCHLAGEITDVRQSWYNRAGVEKVMESAQPQETRFGSLRRFLASNSHSSAVEFY